VVVSGVLQIRSKRGLRLNHAGKLVRDYDVSAVGNQSRHLFKSIGPVIKGEAGRRDLARMGLTPGGLGELTQQRGCWGVIGNPVEVGLPAATGPFQQERRLAQPTSAADSQQVPSSLFREWVEFSQFLFAVDQQGSALLSLSMFILISIRVFQKVSCDR
jgi:hypothetical protein